MVRHLEHRERSGDPERVLAEAVEIGGEQAAPTPDEVEGEPAGYQLVYEEIIRGIHLTTGLVGSLAPEPGWVTVQCHDETMAAWLLRAVMAENVFTRQSREMLWVPAGPRFRLVKEIKNVVVALAKTCHYWKDHLSATDRAAAASLFGAAETARYALFNPMFRFVGEGKPGTLYYRGKPNVFDQLVVSRGLLEPEGFSLEEKSVEIFATDAMKDDKGEPKRFRRVRGGEWVEGYSDHFPVRARLALSAGTPK